MSILESLHAEMKQWSAAVQHGAAWLIGAFNIAQKDLQDAEASDPMVRESVSVAANWAKAQGIPIGEAEQVGSAILGLAKTIAAPEPVAQGFAAKAFGAPQEAASAPVPAANPDHGA